MSLVNQEVENFQNQPQQYPQGVDHCNEEERELEEALSLSDLPINAITIKNQEDGATEEENQNAGDNVENDFDFGSLVGSMGTLDGEMCAADEVFSGGQILPYRNSVSSMSGLQSVSRSDSLDRRRFGSRCSSSRSSSIRSHYSTTSSSSCSSNNTAISAKTVPLVSKAKVQNQFHSYPSPKPQILGSSMRLANSTTLGKKSKMWEVLKLGLVRTPEIELQDLKQRGHRTNNYGKIMTIPRNNSTGSNSSCGSTKASNNQSNDLTRARKSCSNDGNTTTNFILEVQKRRNNNNQLTQNKNDDGSGFFKSCKCSIGAIEPMPSIRSNYSVKNSYFESSVKFTNAQNSKSNSLANQVLNEDKNVAQKKIHQVTEEQKKQRRNKNSSHLRQGKQVMSHHHHRTFEWLKNLSHASVLNN